MAIVKGRHIRHDWRTFNDRQDQKSVRTLCNVTSTPSRSGIPSVTDQKTLLLDAEDKDYLTWGWCWSCTRVFLHEVAGENLDNAPGTIKDLFDALNMFCVDAGLARQRSLEAGNSLYAVPRFKRLSAF